MIIKPVIVQKPAFTMVGNMKRVPFDNARTIIPEFWTEHYASGKGKYIEGQYGLNIDVNWNNPSFEYIIADIYNPHVDYPPEFVFRTIPSMTWAIFSCDGALPKAMHEVDDYILNEWLPNSKEFKLCDGYCMEYYDDPMKYRNGTSDNQYHSELWIAIMPK